KADAKSPVDTRKLNEVLAALTKNAEKLRHHFEDRAQMYPAQAGYIDQLIGRTNAVLSRAMALSDKAATTRSGSVKLVSELDGLSQQMLLLKRQSPKTLFRLRFVEIGLPLVLSIVSIVLTLRYPLTEARCYEIKEALEKRRLELAAVS
ncbi:MAG TPA: hypothetical protein VFW73_08305, partial [Lacipirellulaceae bacterium]|nr:hypothetical protein [Lacipirellulaceae bacterium]